MGGEDTASDIAKKDIIDTRHIVAVIFEGTCVILSVCCTVCDIDILVERSFFKLT